MSEKTLIERIKKNDQEALKKIYLENRIAFIHFLKKKHDANQEDALEVYQFAILRFYDNIIQDKLTTLSSSIKSYLFAIGKNVWREQQRIKQKTHYTADQQILQYILTENNDQLTLETLQEKEYHYKKLAKNLNETGATCKKLLEAFYYENKSMADIAHELGFKNSNVAKTKKRKCLNKLKTLMEEIHNES